MQGASYTNIDVAQHDTRCSFSRRTARIVYISVSLPSLVCSLVQGRVNKNLSTLTIEQEAAENPNLQTDLPDPTLLVTTFKKNRFYLFTTRDATTARATDTDRDVFNEKPSKEDIIAATDSSG